MTRSILRSQNRYYQTTWQPAVDIYRRDKEWLIKIDLAGVQKEDIRLSANRQLLRVTGQRRDLQIKEGHQTYSMEISYNRFERTLELPFNVEDAPIFTEYKDGMLYIHIDTKDES